MKTSKLNKILKKVIKPHCCDYQMARCNIGLNPGQNIAQALWNHNVTPEMLRGHEKQIEKYLWKYGKSRYRRDKSLEPYKFKNRISYWVDDSDWNKGFYYLQGNLTFETSASRVINWLEITYEEWGTPE
jgi:hypothetical protein